MFLRQITDAHLAQNAYLIGCQRTGEAIVIDPERDVDRYLAVAEENGLRITAVAETHIHADYLSGAREMLERHGAVAYLSGTGGEDWQFEWAKGSARARFLKGGEEFRVGNIRFKAIETPGHTPEHLSYLVTDEGGGADEPMAYLTGDFIFVGDVGRPDLLESAAGQEGMMEPSARVLYESLRRTAELAGHLQILPGHGAGSACGKALGAVPTSVLGYERKFNGALREALEGEEERFVVQILSGQPEPPLYFARMKRDNRLGPALLAGGKLPEPERVPADGLVEWVGREGISILDLRGDRAAFAERHLRGAIHAPLAGGKLSVAAGSYVDERARILLVVEDEEQVEVAVRDLVRIGLDRVEGWVFGADAWDESLVEKFVRMVPSELEASACVLDVRGVDEFSASHVRGAVNLAYTRLAARRDEIPEGCVLHVHCAGGLRALIASSYLASIGKRVVWVDGAFSEIAESLKEPGA